MKSLAFAGLSCAREDSNLHPVKPGQGPQPCQACEGIDRTVHMRGLFAGADDLDAYGEAFVITLVSRRRRGDWT